MSFRFHAGSAITPILQRSLNWRQGELRPTPETIEIVMAAGKFESFLKEMLEFVNTRDQYKIGINLIEYLLSQATEEQIEKLVLPKFIYILDKKYDTMTDMSNDLYSALPVIFNKVSSACLKKLLPNLLKFLRQDKIPYDLCEKCYQICIEKMDADTLEKIIMPELLKLFQPFENPYITNTIVKCIEKLDASALKRCLLSELEFRFYQFENSEEEKSIVRNNRYIRDIAFVPYLAMISRFTQQENDSLSKKLLTHLSRNLQPAVADEILTFIKNLQSKNIYVNNDFFQAVQKIVQESNEIALQKKDFFKLYIANLTVAQVKNFVEICLEQQSLNMFNYTSLAKLPLTIYPMQLRMKVLLFLQENLDVERVIKNLPRCLTTGDSSIEFRKVLIAFAQYALQQLTVTSSISKYHYFKLLESSASLMTDDEINRYILPPVRIWLKAFHDQNNASTSECLKKIFSQINNPDIHREFFHYYVNIYINHNIGSEVLPILSEKVDSETLAHAYRKVLHAPADYLKLDRHAYLLALFSKRIPQQTKQSSPEEMKTAITPAIKGPRRTCAMM